ncbi:MAG: hypothetical protein MI867_20225, partial [Pseudomonadales bacterium]|nr:hypothetical protein [Pseudomonadales bacterium]
TIGRYICLACFSVVLLACQTPSGLQTPADSINKEAIATEAYNQAIQKPSLPQYVAALELLESAMKKAPDSQSLRYKSYDLYYRLVYVGLLEYFWKAKSVYSGFPESIKYEVSPPSLAKLKHLQRQKGVPASQLQAVILDILSEAPLNPAGHIELGRYMFLKRGPGASIPFAHQALRLSPESKSIYADLGFYYSEYVQRQTCTYAHQKEIRKAIKYMQLGLNREKPSPFVNDELSYFYDLVNMRPLQLKAAQSAYETENSERFKRTLATALGDSGKWQDSKKLFEEMTANGADDVNMALLEFSLYFGQWDDAVSYGAEFLKSNPDLSFYDVVSLEFAEYKSGVSNNKSYAELIAGVELGQWDSNLDAFWRGELAADSLLAKAGDVCEESEANFYVGLDLLINGDFNSAKPYLKKTLDLKAYNFIEYGYAKRLLKDL